MSKIWVGGMALTRRCTMILLAGLMLGLVSTPATADGRMGVVLLHGKGGIPQGRMMKPLIEALKDAGFLVSTPEMTWSRGRGYDASYEQSMDEIAAAVAAIRAAGATKVVVAGQSQGANAALGFGAQRGGVDGIAAIAPGHVPEYFVTLDEIGRAFASAKALVAAGRGNETSSYPDVGQNDFRTVTTSAANYVSFFDPEGPAVMSRNAASLKPGIALLWIHGDGDRPNMRRGRGYGLDKAPPNAHSRYIVVDGKHGQTPRRGAPQIVEWIKSLQ